MQAKDLLLLVRGIRYYAVCVDVARLDEIERIDSAYAPFTAELWHLVKRFRLNELGSRLQAMLRHDVDKV